MIQQGWAGVLEVMRRSLSVYGGLEQLKQCCSSLSSKANDRKPSEQRFAHFQTGNFCLIFARCAKFDTKFSYRKFKTFNYYKLLMFENVCVFIRHLNLFIVFWRTNEKWFQVKQFGNFWHFPSIFVLNSNCQRIQ